MINAVVIALLIKNTFQLIQNIIDIVLSIFVSYRTKTDYIFEYAIFKKSGLKL